MKASLQIHPADTVAVALQELPGIPAGHKFALRDIAQGEDVFKYGYSIGHATRPIRKGELVDHHNIATNLSGTLDYGKVKRDSDSPPALPFREGAVTCDSENSHLAKHPAPSRKGRAGGESFLGYVRPDGQVGIRNDIWVIPTVGCVNPICRQIVEKAKEEIIINCQSSIVNYQHPYGCSQLGDDHENTRKILRDMVLHPNAGGVLVVGLGCENNQPKEFEKLLGDYDRQRIRFMVCQEVEGDEVETGVRIVKELYEQAQTYERVPVPISKLRIGLKCGGSDGFSGITANPLLGAFTDWLCKEQGGTAILTEVPEMFGAETILMRRAVSDEVLQQTISLINNFKEYFLSHGQPVGENPSPGNKAGGISTLEEKALGCTQKAGTAPVVGVLEYGDRLPQAQGAAPIINCQLSIVNSGLFLLSAPGNDLVASTALAAAGCQLVLFTTGRGTPFSTFVPTLKVSTNSELARRKPQWIDFDAGVLLDGTSMEELLQRFIAYIIDVCSGKEQTTAEAHGNADFAIFKNGVTL
ncbi:MAG: altronate dehydratase [Bacteroidaceae bacterium]|nr:altronate dehydratase [Bacteroidaceae bacterium]